jgi:hypothetical protein
VMFRPAQVSEYRDLWHPSGNLRICLTHAGGR